MRRKHREVLLAEIDLQSSQAAGGTLRRSDPFQVYLTFVHERPNGGVPRACFCGATSSELVQWKAALRRHRAL